MSKKDKPKVGKKAKKAGTFTPTTDFMVIVDEKLIPVTTVEELREQWTDDTAKRQAKQDAEVAAQWAHRSSLADRWRIEDPTGISEDIVLPEPDLPAHEVVRPEFRAALLNIPVFVSPKNGDGLNTWFTNLPHPTTTAESDLLFQLEQKMTAGGIEPGSEVASGKDVPTPPTLTLDVVEAPADPVLQNGNGQAIIHYVDPTTGAEKTKGYTRVTTYIDGLDDKTVLTKWKMRTLLEGAAVEHLLGLPEDEAAIAKVARSVARTDAAVHDIDQREREEGELLELRRQELLKEHRTLLEGIADELMELGGAHEKANKGTNLHRLTQIVDEGGELPADTTASDRRDVEAYRAKMVELDLKVLWCERRVVLDDIQVSGTMDRAYQVRLPGMQRRIRVVGDLKTGSVSYAHGKVATQLALYSRGFGYDWAKPLERERLSLSKAYGLLIHLPQGEGRCEVYVVDLELASKGLALAAEVREWRRVQKRAYDLGKPMVKGK